MGFFCWFDGREWTILDKLAKNVLTFCENETNLKVIQEIMGHSDISTTMDIYAEATDEKKKEILTDLQGKIMVM